MATKRNIRPNAKLFNERLELIDELLYKFGHIQSRYELQNKVNAKLQEPISIDAIDKDINEIKGQLGVYNLKHNTNIELKFNRNTGYHYSERGFRLYKNSVSDEDKNLLLLANSLFNIFNGTPLQGKFGEVVAKVMDQSLTGGLKLESLPNDFVQIENGITSKSIKWIPSLLEAIFEKNCMKIIYKGRTRDMCPYVIKQFKNKWYMVAWDYSSSHTSKTNLYALDNIEDIIGVSNKKFIVDPDFNIEDYFRYSIGIWHEHEQMPVKVKLEFYETRLFNSIQNNPLHHSQHCSLNDSKDKLTVVIEVYDGPELYNIIYNFGSSVKVIEPKSVADKIVSNAKRVLELYS